MPEPTSQAALALIDQLELWREFAFGHKDVWPGTRTARNEPRRSELLERLHELHRAHSGGLLSEQLWTRLLGVLPALLATRQFKAQWESERQRFPADFRALMHRLGG